MTPAGGQFDSLQGVHEVNSPGEQFWLTECPGENNNTAVMTYKV